jgi:hypothetical protein
MKGRHLEEEGSGGRRQGNARPATHPPSGMEKGERFFRLTGRAVI